MFQMLSLIQCTSINSCSSDFRWFLHCSPPLFFLKKSAVFHRFCELALFTSCQWECLLLCLKHTLYLVTQGYSCSVQRGKIKTIPVRDLRTSALCDLIKLCLWIKRCNVRCVIFSVPEWAKKRVKPKNIYSIYTLFGWESVNSFMIYQTSYITFWTVKLDIFDFFYLFLFKPVCLYILSITVPIIWILWNICKKNYTTV